MSSFISKKQEQEWQALVNLAQAHLRYLCETHLEWTPENTFQRLGIPKTELFIRLVNNAGFDRVPLDAQDVGAVVKLWTGGVWSEEIISQETGVPRQIVKLIVNRHAQGYGSTSYGVAPFGRNRALSNGRNMVYRRVTTAGQFSYKGRQYTLGARYRGRIAMIRDEGTRLVAVFADQPTVEL